MSRAGKAGHAPKGTTEMDHRQGTPAEFRDTLRRTGAAREYLSALQDHDECCGIRQEALEILASYGLTYHEFIINELCGAYDA